VPKEGYSFNEKAKKHFFPHLARHHLHCTGLCTQRDILWAVSNLTRQDFRHTSAP